MVFDRWIFTAKPLGGKGLNMDEMPDDIEIELPVGEMFLMYLAYDDERQMKN